MHYLDYNEQKTHGTHSFPMEYYHVDSAHPRYAMPYHWHAEYEIIQILQGEFSISLNSREISAEKGDILLIPGGVIHGGTPHDCVYECIVFDIQMLTGGSEDCRQLVRRIKDQLDLSQPLIHRQAAPESELLPQTAARLFATAREEGPWRALCLGGILQELFAYLYREGFFVPPSEAPSQDGSRQRQKLEQLRCVLRYIEANYPEPITLAQLSAQAGMSPKYFCRFFESIVHKTPMEYLNYYRIERACCQLADTDASVTEVGYNCGFHDTSYFIRMFKREKAMTPRKYQQGAKNPQ